MAGAMRLGARWGLRNLSGAVCIPSATAVPNFCALTGTSPLAAFVSPPFEPTWTSCPLVGLGTLVHVQQFGSSASARQPSREELDLVYRNAINEMWPTTRQHRKLAAKVQAALEQALLHDTVLRETLVQVHGFTVQEVRMSPDNMKAFVLWRAFPQSEAAARVELNRRLTTLRAAAAKRLQLRRMPRLEMRHDSLTDQQSRLEAVMDHIRAEQAADQAHDDNTEMDESTVHQAEMTDDQRRPPR